MSVRRSQLLVIVGVVLAVGAFTTSVASCSSNDGALVSPAGADASNAVADGASADTAASSLPADDDAGAGCNYPLSQRAKCGKCGEHTRECLTNGTWGSWSACTNEREGQDLCDYGSKRSTPCGNCGSVVDVCDPDTCTWQLGTCSGEGCKSGSYETSTAGCATIGDVRSRQCSLACAWGTFSPCGPPKGWKTMATPALVGRLWHVAVWTGTEMIVWGGESAERGSSAPTALLDGAAYDPSKDTWRRLPPLPSSVLSGYSKGNAGASGVWTGSELIIWGGLSNLGDGLIYKPATNSWRRTSLAPTGGRSGHVATWSTTTNRMLVWGGVTSATYDLTNVGLEYDPVADTWATLPPSPFVARRANVAWTGSEMLVWGGTSAVESFVGATPPALPASPLYLQPKGARYAPDTRVWTTMPDFPAVPDIGTGIAGAFAATTAGTATTLYAWGGCYSPYADDSATNSLVSMAVSGGGARYTVSGSWQPLPRAPKTTFGGPQGPYSDPNAWFGGGRFYVWSGRGVGGSAVAAGGIYDPATSTWTQMPNDNAPEARYAASVVWTGTAAIVWGGAKGHTGNTTPGLATGGIYAP